ncbi:MAG: hypothetical protein KJO85_05120 [Gammaproteobacteria bacterium]|nr:hypothetical protein [Gammaproteobacteria bacterium]
MGEVEDANHEVHPGISFQLPRSGWPINRAVAIDKAKAAEFIEFLEHLEQKQFPCSITFSRHDRDLHWEVREFQEKWHGGGGFSGYLQGNWLADHSNPAPVIITRESAARLRRYLSDQYFSASDE